jgi:hypothetical protein
MNDMNKAVTIVVFWGCIFVSIPVGMVLAIVYIVGPSVSP